MFSFGVLCYLLSVVNFVLVPRLLVLFFFFIRCLAIYFYLLTGIHVWALFGLVDTCIELFFYSLSVLEWVFSKVI